MSKTRIITIICWCVSAAVLVGLCVWFILWGAIGGGLNFGSENFNYYETHTFSVDNLSAIEIDWISGRVNVSTHDGDEVIVTEHSRRRLRERDRMNYDLSSGTLTLEFSAARIRFNPPSKMIEVQIPVSAMENITSLSIDNVSGRVEISDVITDRLDVQTVSGRIEISNVTARTISLNTTSGRIETARTQALSISSRTVSGRHNIFGEFETISASSTSGRIELASTIMPDTIDARTTSGRIEVTVPMTDTPVPVRYSVTSGRFRSDIPVITNSSSPQFTLTTTSGRINIYGR